MNNALSSAAPSQNIFWTSNNSTAKQAGIFLFGVVLLALASQISIPLTPVPLTFQSATVVLIGMLFGAKRGTAVVATYLFAGIIGLPVFATASFGPTSGYLLGFIPAAFVAGFLAERGFAKSILQSFIVACISAMIIFAFGLSVLATYIGWHQAVLVGLLPFILSEPIKLFAAACVTPTCWK